MNILWKKPDETLAVTSIFDESDPAEHAVLLQERGDIPADWTVAATNVTQFPEGARQEYWRFVDGGIVVEEPPPVVPVSVTPLDYIERFTEAEQLSIVTAAMSTPELRLWYDKLMAAQEVVFADPRLSGGLDALVSAGLITAERKAELLLP